MSMHRLAILLFTLLATTSTSLAQYGLVDGNGLVSQTGIRRFGLKRAWHTELVGASRGKVAHVRLAPNRYDKLVVHTVTYPGGSFSITEKDRDEFGDILGAEKSRALALAKRDELTQTGKKAELVTRSIPRYTLFVQMERGLLHSIDAETGGLIWSKQFGRSELISLPPAVNNFFVATVNGSTLYVADRANGAVQWQRRLTGGPGGAPALTKTHVFVPLMNGRVDVFPLEKRSYPIASFYSAGSTMVQPLVTENTVSWPSTKGFTMVANTNGDGLRFQVKTEGPVVAAGGFFRPETLIVASTDGYIRAVEEQRGSPLWRFSAGQPLRSQPMVIGENVYASTERGGMFCLDANNGQQKWWVAGVSQFLAATGDRVYTRDRSGRMVVVDAKTGGRLDAAPLPNIDLVFANMQTDRIYVGSRSGLIQCLHETNAKWPTVYDVAEASEKAKPKVILGAGPDPMPEPMPEEPAGDPFDLRPMPEPEPEPEPAAPADDDPFNLGDDPFG